MMSFERLVEQFDKANEELIEKTDGVLFNCCSWVKNFESPDWDEKGVFIRRCKNNVDKIYVLLLDIDGTQTLKQAIDIWQDYEFYIYSTFSHSTEKDKFRLILPLETPLTRLEFDERHDAMASEFNVDGASFTISQAFYLPSYNKENKSLAFTYWNKDKPRYDVMILEKQEINYNVNTEIPNYSTDNPHPLAIPIFNTLKTGSDLHVVDAMPLAILCKSKGLTLDQYKYLVSTMAASDSMLRTGGIDIENLYHRGFNSFMTDNKAIKLMQKLNCDMWRFIK